MFELYREGIVDTGREAQFLFFIAFLLTFAFIRTSAHMIRAQVSWWPGNVSVGGTHIHHLVWGILLLLIFGWIGVAVVPDSPWGEISAVMFGIGTGLTLDEFALWLNLKDVYWDKEGRRSIDAVIIATAFTGLVMVGFRGLLDAADDVENGVFAVTGAIGALGIILAFVNAAKEKFGMAILEHPDPGRRHSQRLAAGQAALAVGEALLQEWPAPALRAAIRRLAGQAVLEARGRATWPSSASRVPGRSAQN